jgi:tetratricopeptide (TPR) repeat protein
MGRIQRKIRILALILLNSAGAFASSARAESSTRYLAELGKCNFQTRASDTERLAACNYLISAGPRGSQVNESTDYLRYVGAFYNRAQVYSRLGDYQKSLQDFDSFFENCERYNVFTWSLHGYYRQRAAVHFLFKQYDAAKTDLQRADDLSKDKGIFEAPLRGDIAMEERDYEAAKQYYGIAIKAQDGQSLYGGKLALAERLAANSKPSSAPSSAPAPPIIQKADSAACKMFPNLC